MAKFVVQGGNILNGSVTPSGNKNEALPALAASILSEESITFQNMPHISDVVTMCEIIKSLGGHYEWLDHNTLKVENKKIISSNPSAILCEKIRASILLLGPILARFGKVELPLPGGDVIGARRIDTHWEGMEALGCHLKLSAIGIQGAVEQLKGCEIFLDEPSVTATENLILASVLAKGTTILHNAACEPHVAGLCHMLNSMNANISGIGTNKIVINGVGKLNGTTHKIGPDFMEVGSFICLGAISGGKIEVKNVNISDLRFILKTFSRIGINYEIKEESLIIDGRQPLSVKNDVTGRIPIIYSSPWPAFPTDLMSVAIVAATQSKGNIIFFEKMFEGRMFFTDKLLSMGANIVLCDPHRIVVNGPSKLIATRMSSPDVRAGMALLMASLIAQGESVIDNIHQIERGYDNIEQKLRSLGADIKKIE